MCRACFDGIIRLADVMLLSVLLKSMKNIGRSSCMLCTNRTRQECFEAGGCDAGHGLSPRSVSGAASGTK